jgi:hypothetical protein
LDSSVGIATGYGLDVRGSIPSRDKILCLYSTASRPALGLTQPPIKTIIVGTGKVWTRFSWLSVETNGGLL